MEDVISIEILGKESNTELDSLNEGVLEELKDKEDDLDTDDVFEFEVEIELLFEL